MNIKKFVIDFDGDDTSTKIIINARKPYEITKTDLKVIRAKLKEMGFTRIIISRNSVSGNYKGSIFDIMDKFRDQVVDYGEEGKFVMGLSKLRAVEFPP